MNLAAADELRALVKHDGRARTAAIAKAEADATRFRGILKHYGVPEDSVHFQHRDEGSTSMYCAESRANYQLVMEKVRTRMPRGRVCMLSDAGNELKHRQDAGGGSIFHDYNIPDVGTFPPDAHHALQPWDSNGHGVAKKETATEMNSNYTDDVRSTVCLMAKLRGIAADRMERWFRFDLAWDIDRADDDALEAACKEIVSKNTSRWADYHKECLEDYYAEFPDEQVTAADEPAPKRQKIHWLCCGWSEEEVINRVLYDLKRPKNTKTRMALCEIKGATVRKSANRRVRGHSGMGRAGAARNAELAELGRGTRSTNLEHETGSSSTSRGTSQWTARVSLSPKFWRALRWVHITKSRGRARALPTSRGAVNRQTFGEAQNTMKTGPK